MTRRSFLKSLAALPVIGICFKSLVAEPVVETPANTIIYHLLTREDYCGMGQWIGTAWAEYYKCPCGQIHGMDHHITTRSCLRAGAFRCLKCGCILSFYQGDIRYLDTVCIATEEMIEYPYIKNLEK